MAKQYILIALFGVFSMVTICTATDQTGTFSDEKKIPHTAKRSSEGFWIPVDTYFNVLTLSRHFNAPEKVDEWQEVNPTFAIEQYNRQNYGYFAGYVRNSYDNDSMAIGIVKRWPVKPWSGNHHRVFLSVAGGVGIGGYKGKWGVPVAGVGGSFEYKHFCVDYATVITVNFLKFKIKF